MGKLTTGEAQALAGVKVLDLTRFPPGAYCTVLLADLGADVVRIDAPGANTMFFGISTGIGRAKRSVAVDLRHPDATDVLKRLVAWADVVVDNARPGSLDERGYGPKRATEEHPSLIWCSITGYGQDGPYADWAGHDISYFAHSGMLAGINPALPWHPQVVVAIPIGGLMAVTGITTALFDRERTGRGAHLDISLAEATTWTLSGSDGHLTDSSYGIPVSPARHLYQCSDGQWITTAADEPRTWTALCTGLGLEDLGEAGRPSGDAEAAALARFQRRVRHPSRGRMGRRARAPRRADQHGAPGLDVGRRPPGARTARGGRGGGPARAREPDPGQRRRRVAVDDGDDAASGDRRRHRCRPRRSRLLGHRHRSHARVRRARREGLTSSLRRVIGSDL